MIVVSTAMIEKVTLLGRSKEETRYFKKAMRPEGYESIRAGLLSERVRRPIFEQPPSSVVCSRWNEDMSIGMAGRFLSLRVLFTCV